MIRLKTFSHKPIFSAKFRAAAVLALGIAAGLVNGFLGTGGGIVLMAAMAMLPPGIDPRDRFATVIAVILPVSLVSAAAYGENLDLRAALPYLFPGILGGVTGALLLDHISPKLLRRIFAAMMIWAGINFLR